MFCIPPIDPFLHLGRIPHASESWRDRDVDDQLLGVVVIAIGCCECADDFVLDESEVEVEDVEVNGADFVIANLPPQRHSQPHVQLHACERQIVRRRHCYEAQSFFAVPERPHEDLIRRSGVTQCGRHDLDFVDIPQSHLDC